MSRPPNIKPRSKAHRLGRELTLRLLYTMDMSDVTAEVAWTQIGSDALFEDLPRPETPLSISIDGPLPRITTPKPENPDGPSWSDALAVSDAVSGPAPKHTPSTAELAAGLARTWSAAFDAQREEINAIVQKASPHWRLSRMAIIDRNILRLGAFEILSGTTPPRDAIYDCVELAKKYGDKPTPGFVNGILDQICRNQGVKL